MFASKRFKRKKRKQDWANKISTRNDKKNKKIVNNSNFTTADNIKLHWTVIASVMHFDVYLVQSDTMVCKCTYLYLRDVQHLRYIDRQLYDHLLNFNQSQCGSSNCWLFLLFYLVGFLLLLLNVFSSFSCF